MTIQANSRGRKMTTTSPLFISFKVRTMKLLGTLNIGTTAELWSQIEMTVSPGSSATGMGQFPICKLKRDLFRSSVTACTIDKNTFSAPFGTFYVTTEI